METEIRKYIPSTVGTRLQCPICRGATHISSHQRKERYHNIFRQTFERLFHQRVCGSCHCCFSTFKIADSLRSLCMPIMTWIFPYLSDLRTEEEHLQSTTPEHSPRLPDERSFKKRRKNTVLSSPIPFSIDRKNREITFQIQCPLEKGNFAEQINAAAISLQTHLRLAADQINSLVLSNSLNKTDEAESTEVTDLSKKLKSGIQRKTRQKRQNKSHSHH